MNQVHWHLFWKRIGNYLQPNHLGWSEERKKITTEKNEKEVVYFWKEKAIEKKKSLPAFTYVYDAN